MAESPTFARRQLGLMLARSREAAGLKLEEAAKRLRAALTTVRRWESGETRVSGPVLMSLCTLYNVPPADQAVMEALADTGRQPVWWAPYKLPDEYRDLIGLEIAADEVAVYEPQFVHGLLQTEDYARALIRASLRRATPDVIEGRVHVRTRRQEVLTRDEPVKLSAVLDESVLVRPIGGREVAAAQLDHLAAMAKLDHVSVQILPYHASDYGHSGSFALLTFPGGAPPVVYVEGLSGDLYPDAEAVREYTVVHDHLRTVAASREESLRLIMDARDAMTRT